MRTIKLTEREASVLLVLLENVTSEETWLGKQAHETLTELQFFHIFEVKHKLERAKKEEFHA